jgi:hypothetical protein
MRVLVCGGRDFINKECIFDRLDKVHNIIKITLIIEGEARGVDSIARSWAESRNVNLKPVPANWELYGKRAGPIRNSEMLKELPDVVIAFPGGVGTRDMINRAKKNNIKVVEFTCQ